jgi:hypothetical protein
LRNGTATFLVSVHFALLVAHGSAHSHLSIGVSTWQKAFIAIVMFVAPLVATIMLWTSARKLGVILLGLSLGGSLIFGMSYHFFVAGPDNALGHYRSHWGSTFLATATLLALVEAAGFIWCIWIQHRTIRNGLDENVL